MAYDVVQKGPENPFLASSTALAQLGHNILILDEILTHPNDFFQKKALAILDESYDFAKPHIKHTFTVPLKDNLSAFGSFFFTLLQQSAPYISEACKTSKLALQIMLTDIFEAFMDPLPSSSQTGKFPLEGGFVIALIGVSLLTHKLALHYLKEDPKQANSITYGAITGTLVSCVMDHDVCIGMLSGAVVGLITDTAISCITYNSITTFFKNQYKKFKVQQRAEAVQKFSSQVLPYLFFTLGTALVYSRINPLISKLMEGEPIPSKKIHVMKVVALSGVLFGMGKSYFTPLVKSVVGHVKVGIKSAYDTGVVISWTPRILTILCVSSLISKSSK